VTLNDYLEKNSPLDDRDEHGVHDCSGECLKNWREI